MKTPPPASRAYHGQGRCARPSPSAAGNATPESEGLRRSASWAALAWERTWGYGRRGTFPSPRLGSVGASSVRIGGANLQGEKGHPTSTHSSEPLAGDRLDTAPVGLKGGQEDSCSYTYRLPALMGHPGKASSASRRCQLCWPGLGSAGRRGQRRGMPGRTTHQPQRWRGTGAGFLSRVHGNDNANKAPPDHAPPSLKLAFTRSSGGDSGEPHENPSGENNPARHAKRKGCFHGRREVGPQSSAQRKGQKKGPGRAAAGAMEAASELEANACFYSPGIGGYIRCSEGRRSSGS